MSTLSVLSILVLAVSQVTYAALPGNYQSLSAQEKQSILFTKISSTPYPILPIEAFSVFTMANAANPLYHKPTFIHDSDEMPSGRDKKIFHPYGTTAKVELRIFNNSTYTGAFQAGAVGLGIARISIAAVKDDGFAPGMGVKLLFDGRSSINIFSLYTLEGQGLNYNVFENSFTNVIPDPLSLAIQVASKALALALRLLPGGSDDRPESEQNMPLYEAASYNSNGRPVPLVRAPYQIIFKPNQALSWDANTATDFRVNLANIPPQTKIYDVEVKRTLDSAQEKIGELFTSSNFVSSAYQDQVLFMKHPTKPWRA